MRRCVRVEYFFIVGETRAASAAFFFPYDYLFGIEIELRLLSARSGHPHNASYRRPSSTSHSKRAIRLYVMSGRLNPGLTDIENFIVTGVDTSRPTKARSSAVKKSVVFRINQKCPSRASRATLVRLTFSSSFQRLRSVNETAYRLCAGLYGVPASGPAARRTKA